MINGLFICTSLFPMEKPDIPSVMKTADGKLLEAAAAGNKDGVVKALTEKADVNVRDQRNRTALYFAAAHNHEIVVSLLLDRGAETDDACTKDEHTPLHKATIEGHNKVVALLLQRGASTEVFDLSHETPLHKAANSGNEEAVRLLLKKSANAEATSGKKKTPLHAAAFSRRPSHEIVKLLLLKGAQIEVTDNKGRTPLHDAAEQGNTAMVKLLLDRNANIAADKVGWTALHDAANSGWADIVKLLLDKHADRTAVSEQGLTPLHLAARRLSPAIVRLLLETENPTIDAADSGGSTPLHCAIRNSSDDFLPINADNSHGRSIEVITLLLDNKANLEASEKDGSTALHIAAHYGLDGLVELLLDKHAKLEATNNKGMTPLRLAALAGHQNAVELLLARGASRETITRNDIDRLPPALEARMRAPTLLCSTKIATTAFVMILLAYLIQQQGSRFLNA